MSNLISGQVVRGASTWGMAASGTVSPPLKGSPEVDESPFPSAMSRRGISELLNEASAVLQELYTRLSSLPSLHPCTVLREA